MFFRSRKQMWQFSYLLPLAIFKLVYFCADFRLFLCRRRRLAVSIGQTVVVFDVTHDASLLVIQRFCAVTNCHTGVVFLWEGGMSDTFVINEVYIYRHFKSKYNRHTSICCFSKSFITFYNVHNLHRAALLIVIIAIFHLFAIAFQKCMGHHRSLQHRAHRGWGGIFNFFYCRILAWGK